jgi:hypothetical protein
MGAGVIIFFIAGMDHANRMVSLAKTLQSHAEDMCKKSLNEGDLRFWQAEISKWTTERARAERARAVPDWVDGHYESPPEGRNVLEYVTSQAELCEDKVRKAEERLKSAKSNKTKKDWQRELKKWTSEKARMDEMVLRWSTEPAAPPTPPEERKRRQLLKVSPQSLIIVSSRGPFQEAEEADKAEWQKMWDEEIQPQYDAIREQVERERERVMAAMKENNSLNE